ncbi:chromosomal replication initiator protein DnaA [Eggerthellaceae bacterium 3-80]|nr:chromosomal replication initiator protein DnaA [bacterium D16-34]
MDSNTLTQSWNSVYEKIKTYDGVTPSQVDAFFSRIQPQAMSEGFLMLTADTDFIKFFIEREFLPYIKRALEEQFSVPFTVMIEVDPLVDQSASLSTEVITPHIAVSQPTVPAPQQTQSITVAQNTNAQIEPVSHNNSFPTVENLLDDPDYYIEEPTQPKKAKPAFSQNNTYSSYTFENFVIGDSNRIAHTMAVTVAEQPGRQTYNPLFIYGRSGLGKTHLLCAMRNYIEDTRPELNTIYVDADELVNNYTESALAYDKDKSSYKNFKDLYEDADVLFIDDVQQLQGKKQTLDIVFQIFNTLIHKGKQVVLSADRAPHNIDIDERYYSRFNQGGTFDIQPPELETKLGIIKLYIKDYNQTNPFDTVEIPDDVQLYIAENSGPNIRELKSAVLKIISKIKIEHLSDMTISDVRRELENHFSGGSFRRFTSDDIIEQVKTFYKVSDKDLKSSNRAHNVAFARQVAFFLIKQFTDLTFQDIGKQFNRHHSTVITSVQKIEKLMITDREVSEEIDVLSKMIREG